METWENEESMSEAQEIDYPDEETERRSDSEAQESDVSLESEEEEEFCLWKFWQLQPQTRVPLRLSETCAVCLENFIDTNARTCYCSLSCGNRFHSSCVAQVRTCPLCRVVVSYFSQV